MCMHSYQWTPGSGVLFSTVGKLPFLQQNAGKDSSWVPITCHCSSTFLQFIILNHYSLNCRDVDLTERLDYSSAVALLGYSLILAILRCFNVRVEAARVMVAAPLVAFVTTHILFINTYKLDYGIVTLPLYLCSHMHAHNHTLIANYDIYAQSFSLFFWMFLQVGIW